MLKLPGKMPIEMLFMDYANGDFSQVCKDIRECPFFMVFTKEDGLEYKHVVP